MATITNINLDNKTVRAFSAYVGDNIRTGAIDRSLRILVSRARAVKTLANRQKNDDDDISPKLWGNLKRFLWAVWDEIDPALE